MSEADDRMTWRQPRRTIGHRLLVGLVTIVFVLAACGDDGRARVDGALENVPTPQRADAEAEPGPSEPVPEETAPTEPPAETTTITGSTTAPEPDSIPTDAGPDDDGLPAGAWIAIVLVGLGALALFMAARASRRRRAEARAQANAALHHQLSDVIGRSRWLHDSGSVEVLLVTDRQQLARAWDDVRTRMIDLESQISTLVASSRDRNVGGDLRYLRQCVSELRSAEEAYVTTQLRAPTDRRELTRTSTQTVHDRRLHLQAAIERVANALWPRR